VKAFFKITILVISIALYSKQIFASSCDAFDGASSEFVGLTANSKEEGLDFKQIGASYKIINSSNFYADEVDYLPPKIVIDKSHNINAHMANLNDDAPLNHVQEVASLPIVQELLNTDNSTLKKRSRVFTDKLRVYGQSYVDPATFMEKVDPQNIPAQFEKMRAAETKYEEQFRSQFLGEGVVLRYVMLTRLHADPNMPSQAMPRTVFALDLGRLRGGNPIEIMADYLDMLACKL
jgi:hypothetical protein